MDREKGGKGKRKTGKSERRKLLRAGERGKRRRKGREKK